MSTRSRIPGISLLRNSLKTAFNIVGLDIVNKAAYEGLRQDTAQLASKNAELSEQNRSAAVQINGMSGEVAGLKDKLAEVGQTIGALTEKNTTLTAKNQDLTDIAAEYQLKLERKPDYQVIMAMDQIRAGTVGLEPEFVELYEKCREYTMTSWERLYALYKAIYYVVQNKIPGDIVECGVWRGGSMRLAAMTLKLLGDTSRTLYLYDTYEGMTEPDAARDIDLHGNVATNDWVQIRRRGVKWSFAPVEEVRDTMSGSGYPMDKIVFVKGPVEQTIPGTLPGKTALLRLDTDWYASTKQEIEHLYPLLNPNGVLALDDYGHYRGAQQAIDEYFSNQQVKPLLLRIDYACRFAIKPAL